MLQFAIYVTRTKVPIQSCYSKSAKTAIRQSSKVSRRLFANRRGRSQRFFLRGGGCEGHIKFLYVLLYYSKELYDKRRLGFRETQDFGHVMSPVVPPGSATVRQNLVPNRLCAKSFESQIPKKKTKLFKFEKKNR